MPKKNLWKHFSYAQCSYHALIPYEMHTRTNNVESWKQKPHMAWIVVSMIRKHLTENRSAVIDELLSCRRTSKCFDKWLDRMKHDTIGINFAIALQMFDEYRWAVAMCRQNLNRIEDTWKRAHLMQVPSFFHIFSGNCATFMEIILPPIINITKLYRFCSWNCGWHQ